MLAAGIAGGGVTAAVLIGTGAAGGGATRTVVQTSSLGASASPMAQRSSGLTARDIYKRDAPGVVLVRAHSLQTSSSSLDLSERSDGVASAAGFLIDTEGRLLTNAHVVAGATDISVTLSDERTVPARVLGKDEETDLALLRVAPKGLDLVPLELGSSRNVQVGDPTVSIGNPYGRDRTLTTGIVSAKQRRITAPSGFSVDNVIQTDGVLSPGNAGGPLLDATGRVIGVNSQIEADGPQGSVGMGFAVPIDTAKKIIPELKKSGRVDRGYLGVSTATIDKSLSGLDLPVKQGALVQSVTPGSPADKAGLRAGDISASVNGSPIQLGGDIITEIDGKAIRSNDDLTAAVAGRRPGDKVTITFKRDGKDKTVEVTLADRPASADATTPATTP